MKDCISIVVTISFCFTCLNVMAEPGAPPATPIDGGLGLLLSAGALYGIGKLKNKSPK